MPTRYHLFQDLNDRYILNYTFDFDNSDILAENYTLNIILPEGSSNIKVHLPFEVDSMETSSYFSTLDYIGKPMISIKKANVISYLHKQPFQVSITLHNTGNSFRSLTISDTTACSSSQCMLLHSSSLASLSLSSMADSISVSRTTARLRLTEGCKYYFNELRIP